MKLWNSASAECVLTLVGLDAGENWLVFTPDGRYDGSEGGRKLVMFRVGQGQGLVPGERLAENLYRPGLLGQILAVKSK